MSYPTWPRWARNAFVLQLVLNVAFVALILFLHFSGQARDKMEREALLREIVAHGDRVEEAETKLRDWWAIDTRNMRDKVQKDVEKILRESQGKEENNG